MARHMCPKEFRSSQAKNTYPQHECRNIEHMNKNHDANQFPYVRNQHIDKAKSMINVFFTYKDTYSELTRFRFFELISFSLDFVPSAFGLLI